MTLGQLIDTLAGFSDQYAEVLVGGQRPGDLRSYRGDYSHLAIETAATPATVRGLRERCEAAVGETFEGHKGGRYVMDRDTPVWLADWGDCPGAAIVGFAMGTDGRLLFKTADIQEYR